MPGRVPTRSVKLSDLDFVAIVLFTASVVPLLVGLSFAGSLYQWADWRTIVPISLGGVSLLLFISRELYPRLFWFAAGKKDLHTRPLLGLRALANPRKVTTYMGAVVLGMLVSFPPREWQRLHLNFMSCTRCCSFSQYTTE
jgi:hypothetical protein